MNILFVCTGNTCRSPMAAALMNKIAVEQNLDVRIESAGLAAFEGEKASENAIIAMERLGVDLSQHRSQYLTEELLKKCDLILTMTESQKKAVKSYSDGKVFTLMEYAGLSGDISDPYGGGEGEYLACAVQIYDAIVRIAEKIKNDD